MSEHPLPAHLQDWVAGLAASNKAMIRGSLWQKPDVNYRHRVEALVRMMAHAGFSLDDMIHLAQSDDPVLGPFDGFNKNHILITRQAWKRLEAEKMAHAQAAIDERRLIDQHLDVSNGLPPRQTIEPRPWLAPPYIMRRQITLIHGGGGEGKSQFGLTWAIALALGRRFGELSPRQRYRVLIANFEDEKAEQARRAFMVMDLFGTPDQELRDCFLRVGRIEQPGVYGDSTMFTVHEGAVCPTTIWEAFNKQVALFKPDVVFLDPFIATNAVGENGNVDMRRVMDMLRGLAVVHNCALVVIHHDKKGTSDDEDDDQNNARGAGDIIAAVRFELALKTMTKQQAEAMGVDDDQRHNYFRLGSFSSKRNYAAPQDSEWFTKFAPLFNGEEIARCEPWMPPNQRSTAQQLDDIVAAVAQGTKRGPYSPQLGNTDRSLAPAMMELGVISPAAQRRALRDLERTGRIERWQWKASSHNGTRWRAGLRASSGEPHNYRWQNGEDSGRNDA